MRTKLSKPLNVLNLISLLEISADVKSRRPFTSNNRAPPWIMISAINCPPSTPRSFRQYLGESQTTYAWSRYIEADRNVAHSFRQTRSKESLKLISLFCNGLQVPNSPKCNNSGTFECGSCTCNDDRYGKNCECDGSDLGSQEYDATCKMWVFFLTSHLQFVVCLNHDMPVFSVFCHLSCHLVSCHILLPSQLWSALISLSI